MNKKVFISGSISIKEIPEIVKDSIRKIIENKFEILVGDADGIDTLIQRYCNNLKYTSVTVYSVYSIPRFKIDRFDSKYIPIKENLKKERERQQVKDEAMTLDSEYSLIVWDGKSKGSYRNILRAIEHGKKTKVYLSHENDFIKLKKINENEIGYIYRKNVGYTAGEVVEYLKGEGEEYFQNTRAFNKHLMDNSIIKKEDGIYKPMPEYDQLFFVEKYRGKAKGIRFRNEFIDWIEDRLKKINRPHEDQSLF